MALVSNDQGASRPYSMEGSVGDYRFTSLMKIASMRYGTEACTNLKTHSQLLRVSAGSHVVSAWCFSLSRTGVSLVTKNCVYFAVPDVCGRHKSNEPVRLRGATYVSCKDLLFLADS